MSLGQRLLELRKNKNMSQEEAAEKLNVTRQTISKWETDASTPDFDKIMPLCNLYNITPDELLTGNKSKKISKANPLLLYSSILLYFLSLIWIIISEETLRLNDGIIVSVFLIIIAVATILIISYSKNKNKNKEEKQEKPPIKNPLYERITSIIETTTLIIYLVVSFITMAWHITWLIWIISELIIEIIKLIFAVKDDENEK